MFAVILVFDLKQVLPLAKVLSAGMVWHYPLFHSAIEEETMRISALLLVVRPRRLLRFALLHTVLCTHNWCRDTRTLVRRTFHRTDGYVR